MVSKTEENLELTTIGRSISVVIPTRNSEHFIREQIQSLWSVLVVAGVEVKEIVIVDDASEDQTSRCVAHLASDSYPITLIRHQKQRGLQDSVSTGLLAAKCPYVLICEDDFQYSSEAIRSLVEPVFSGEADAAVACRRATKRIVTSFLFWKFLKFVTAGRIPGRELMLRFVGIRMLKEINSAADVVRTITGLMLKSQLRIVHVEVSELSTDIRKSGQTNRQRLELFLDVFLTLERYPLTFVIYLSGIFAVSAIVSSVVGVILTFRNGTESNTVILYVIAVVALVTLSFLLWSLGIISHLLSIVLQELRGKRRESPVVATESSPTLGD